MTNFSDFNGPYVHLAVDWTDYYLKELSERKKKSLVKNLDTFIESTHGIVSTIWLMGPHQEYKISRAADMTTEEHAALVKKCGFSSRAIQPDQDIFGKQGEGAFDDIFGCPKSQSGTYKSQFRIQLETYYPASPTLLISGAYTRACVKGTVVGAIMEGYNCIALPDLLTNGKPDLKDQFTSLKKSVVNCLKYDAPDLVALADDIDQHLTGMTTTEFLAFAKIKQAPPLKKAPASKLKVLTT